MTMKARDLAKKLLELADKHGDKEVFFTDPNSPYGPFTVENVTTEVADVDEYPEDFNMPEGFTFFHISNL